MAGERLPDLPPPEGESFRFVPQPGAVFGTTGFKVKVVGGARVRGVRLHVDGAAIGERMAAMPHGLWYQELDTSYFLDGIHEMQAAALDKDGKLVATTTAKVDFKNVERLEILNIQPHEDWTGFTVDAVVHAIRVPLPRELFTVLDRAGTVREPLTVAEVTYTGGVTRGNLIPVARIRTQRARGQTLAPGPHRVTVAVNDLQGYFRANATASAEIPALRDAV